MSSSLLQTVQLLSLCSERVKHDRRMFIFCSNLADVLAFLHVLKSILKQRPNTDQLIKSCIESFIMHQEPIIFLMIPLIKDLSSAFTTAFSSDSAHPLIPTGRSVDDMIITGLVHLLYKSNTTDVQLFKLIRAQRKKCLKRRIISCNIKPCLDGIPVDILCHLLSFLSPLHLHPIQRVSYSFYSALQRPACYSVLDEQILYQIEKFDKQYSADMLALQLDLLEENEVTFFSKYALITRLSVSSSLKYVSIPFFGFDNALDFYNKFANLREIKLVEFEDNIEVTLESMICSQYLPDTLTVLEVIQDDDAEPMEISPDILKYLQMFSKLKSFCMDGWIVLDSNLKDSDYVRDHYVELQSYIHHIHHIRVACTYFEDIHPLFFSLFFHSNLKSLDLGLGRAVPGDIGLDAFLDTINDMTFDNRKLLGLEHLKHLQAFEISCDPYLCYDWDDSMDMHVWFAWLVESMHQLQSFKVSRWSGDMLFGPLIHDIDVADNILYKVIRNNSMSLKRIVFSMEGLHGDIYDGWMEQAWLPLFAMHNVMFKANQFEYIEHWMRDVFEQYTFHLHVRSHCLGDAFLDDCMNRLKIYLSAKIQSTIRSLIQLFQQYDIEYCIKLEFSQPTVMELYANCFKSAKVCDEQLIFQNDNQMLITDFFPVI